MIRRPPRSPRTDTRFPYTTLFRSLLPFVIAGVISLHIWALHIPGSNNPTGVDVQGPQDTIPFHPYYTAKDGFGLGVFLIIFAATVYFAPNYLGHPDNYIPANPLSTPARSEERRVGKECVSTS